MVRQLETNRLVLKRGRPTLPTAEELETDYHRYVVEFEDPSVTFEQYKDVVLLSYFSAKEDNPFGYYTLFPKDGDRWIGHCPLIPRLCSRDEQARFRPSLELTLTYHTLELEIGWALSIYHRRQGYATEAAQALITYAFQTLKVPRIVAFTERENQASVHVMRRLGMYVDIRPDLALVVGCIENSI